MNKKAVIFFITMAVAMGAFGKSKWDNLLISGTDYFNKGQYEFAITSLKKYLLVESQEFSKPNALYYLSLSYYFSGNSSLALVHIDELTSKYKTSMYAQQVIFWRGLIYQNEGRWREAEEAFLRFIKLLPSSDLADRAILAAANCQYEFGDMKRSQKTLEPLVFNEKSVKFEEANVLYIYILMNEGENSKALQLLDEWETRLGDDGGDYKYKDRFWLYKAEVLKQNGNLKEAVRLLKKIDNYARASASSDIALLRLSEIEAERGNASVSAEYIIRLKSEYPNSSYNIDALQISGIAAYKAGSYKKGIQLFDETIEAIDERLATIESREQKGRLELVKSYSILFKAESLWIEGKKTEAFDVISLIIENELPLEVEARIRGGEFLLESGDERALREFLLKTESFMKKRSIAGTLRERYDLLYATYLLNSKRYKESLERTFSVSNRSEYFFNAISIQVKNYIALSETDKAIELLQVLLPSIQLEKRAEVVYNLMTLQFNAGNYKETLRLAETLTVYYKNISKEKQFVYEIQRLNLEALSQMQLRNYDEGIETFKRLQFYKEDRRLDDVTRSVVNQSFYYLGWIYYKKSAFTEAGSLFAAAQLVLTDRQLKKDATVMNAWSYYSSQQYPQAAKLFTSIFDDYYPEESAVEALFQAGKCYQNMKDDTKAKSVFTRIYTQMGQNEYRSHSLYELIRLAFLEKDDATAGRLIGEFGQRYSEDPLYSSVLLLQIERLVSQERYSEVQSNATDYLRRFPEQNEVDNLYYWAGFSALENRDYGEAESMFNKLLVNYPTSSYRQIARESLIKVFDKSGQLAKELSAIEDYHRENFLGAKNYDTRVTYIKERLAGVDEQEATLTVEASNGDIESSYKLAVYYYNRDEVERATELFEEIKSSDSGVVGARANNFLADLDYNKGDYKTAAISYAGTLKYKATDTEHSEAVYKVAYCYYKLGVMVQAVKYLEILQERYPQSKWVENAKSLKESIK